MASSTSRHPGHIRAIFGLTFMGNEANNALYRGMGDTTPQGAANRFISAIATPFEQWPEEVKNGFKYDPDGVETLLDEAGYPRGADGTRFKAEMSQLPDRDFNYMQLVASYWGKVGIDVEITVKERSNWIAKRSGRDFEMMNSEMAVNWRAQDMTGRFKSTANYNTSKRTMPGHCFSWSCKSRGDGADSLVE